MPLHYYYLDADDQQQGPLDANAIRELIRTGVIGPLTQFRTDRMSNWVHAFNIKEMFPDYNPHRPDRPQATERPWGYEALLSLLQKPVRTVVMLMLFAILLQTYRSLAVPWMFPPNQQPLPRVDRDALVKLLSSDAGVSDGPLPMVSKEEKSSNTSPIKAPIKALDKALDKAPSPRRILEGNSVLGQVHRAVMADQLCILPKRMNPLPSSLPDGRFFFAGIDSTVIFASASGRETLNSSVWKLSSVVLNDYSNHFEPAHRMGHLKSYAQADRFFSFFVAPVEKAILAGSMRDWRELSLMKSRFDFRLNTNVGIVARDRLFPISFVSMAITGEPGRQRIAISDFDLPTQDQLEDFVREPDAPLLVHAHRLRIMTWPHRRTLSDKTGDSIRRATLNKNVYQKQGAIEGAEPYLQLAFSRTGDYLAGCAANGQVDVYTTDSLDYVFTVPDVHMGGPYLNEVAAHDYVAHRLCFSPMSDLLLVNDRGQLAVCDIRTEQVKRIRLPGDVHAYCFDKWGDIVAASAATGEVYRIDSRTRKVTSKALLAGLGPACVFLNFSFDGECLSAIAQESLVFGNDRHVGCDPTRWAMFWSLQFEPSDRLTNDQVWHCRPELRKDYPGHQGSFVCLATGNGSDTPRCLLTVTYERETDELHVTPFRALAQESQKQALLLHSLVERVDGQPHFDPYQVMTFDPPAWKPIHQGPLTPSVVAAALKPYPRPSQTPNAANYDPVNSPYTAFEDPLR